MEREPLARRYHPSTVFECMASSDVERFVKNTTPAIDTLPCRTSVDLMRRHVETIRETFDNDDPFEYPPRDVNIESDFDEDEVAECVGRTNREFWRDYSRYHGVVVIERLARWSYAYVLQCEYTSRELMNEAIESIMHMTDDTEFRDIVALVSRERFDGFTPPEVFTVLNGNVRAAVQLVRCTDWNFDVAACIRCLNGMHGTNTASEAIVCYLISTHRVEHIQASKYHEIVKFSRKYHVRRILFKKLASIYVNQGIPEDVMRRIEEHLSL